MKKKYLLLLTVLTLSAIAAGCGKKQEAAKVEAKAQAAQVSNMSETASAAKTETAKPVETAQPQTAKPVAPITEWKTLFSFEKDTDGFEIPSWAEEKADNAGKGIGLSKDLASDGTQSLRIDSDFPGQIWSSALIELEQYLDLAQYRAISVDIYVPKDAPLGLKGKFVLTVGEDWTWTEMVTSVALNPGEWSTVTASIEPGSMDWKRTEVTDAFRSDIRKIVVRVESNKKPIYKGPIYIDNIRAGK
jgi:hypothetical protein